MFENDANNSPSHNDGQANSSDEYLRRAAAACASGDAVLGMHLYLAAFERAQHSDGTPPDEDALAGLKQAWSLACTLKERSIAEYAFERLEPYLTQEEVAACADQLQSLALDKLEEFGLSREDLEDMTDMISQDFLGAGGARLMRVEHVTALGRPAEAKRPPGGKDGSSEADAKPAVAEDAASADAGSSLVGEAADSARPSDPGARRTIPREADAMAGLRSTAPAMETISYKDLVGYDETVALMRDFGVGMQHDERFQELVSMLNDRHGLDRMPASDALLFRSPAREDANRFVAATLGELGLPAIRMRMEENLQGVPVLCVMAQADRQPRLNASRTAFEGAGVLVLEDIDLWVSPLVDVAADDLGGFLMASLSRGAREAIGLIRSAVENPDVHVLASAAESSEIDPFFYELLEPLSFIDIDYPSESERADIWMEIARDHPSVRGVDRAVLVRYSAQMPRYDMYMAAREAIEEAYKASLVSRRYVPVTADNLFDKLAAYQPLDSDEYRALEEAVVSGFRRELEHVDDLLKKEES
ncbi:ribonucleotide reductase subunit alpha [Gordonibacter sp. An230]|uniref:ribonucleotide reductase subunit alpha n=1 Tax=Gordonibacter sp. An230 TaxID=1965592 RepID=UPI000B38A216|nr:ribonucleotide reductase subunit alpha [Gordonibacter sp. An230]OUO90926.1 ribonucleotide reductase subunit alpha [Gordonibacter sp. An230]